MGAQAPRGSKSSTLPCDGATGVPQQAHTSQVRFMYCSIKATPKLSGVKQQPFYHAHGFCGLGIQKG